MSERPIEDADLQAYVDGEILPERRRLVEDQLARDQELARRVFQYSAQRAALREALSPVAREPIPDRLSVSHLLRQRARRRWARPWALTAAAAILFALGAVSGYQLHGMSTPARTGVRALAREAADSFRVHVVDPARPVEIDAEGKDELVRWFSGRLRSQLAVPDLLAAGYRFLGGRLVTTPHGPAALFVYANPSGDKLAVLARPMAVEKNTRMSEHTDGMLGTVAWAEHGIGYGLVGTSAPRTLHPLADEVRRQLRAANMAGAVSDGRVDDI